MINMKIKLTAIMVALAIAGCNHDSIPNPSDTIKPDIPNIGEGDSVTGGGNYPISELMTQ